MFERVKANIVSFLFPTTCLFCKTGVKEICENCFKEIPKQIQDTNQIISFYSFKNEKINKMLWRLKYHHTGYFAEIFGSILAKEFDVQKNYFLIPIPLSKGDKRMYNHAELLANSISKNFSGIIVAGGGSINVIPDLLIKKSKIKQAHTKNRQERFENIKDSFSINLKSLPALGEINSQIFVLIDDVTTTGATINSARKVISETLNIKEENIKAMVIAH